MVEGIALSPYDSAVSPDDGVESACNMRSSKFRKIFAVRTVDRLDDLIGRPQGVADAVVDGSWNHDIIHALTHSHAEKLMNGCIQTAINKSFPSMHVTSPSKYLFTNFGCLWTKRSRIKRNPSSITEISTQRM